MDISKEPADQLKTNLKCVVCGSALYPTDRGNQEIIYHCSSPEARFWDFERGSPDLTASKEHWDKSKQEIFLHQN